MLSRENSSPVGATGYRVGSNSSRVGYGSAPATTTTTTTTAKRRLALTAIALGLSAGLISFLGSWHVSLWTDEAATISSGKRSFPDLWRELHQVDAVHGLYYALMHLWISLFGSSAVSVRLPSALAVAVATAGVFVLVQRLTGETGLGVLSAAVFALLPRVTWMGIEARSYALTAAGAVWLTLLLLRAIRAGGARWWAAYAVLGGCCVALDIYLGLLLCAQGLTVLLIAGRTRRRFTAWAVCGLAAVVLASPVVYLAHGESGQLGDVRLGPVSLARQILVNQWFLGATPTATTGVTTIASSSLGIAREWQPAAVLLATLSWCLVVLGLVLRRRQRSLVVGRAGTSPEVLLPWLIVPTVLLAAAAVAGSPLYNPRYLSFAAPALAILMASGLQAILRTRVRLVVGLILVALVIPIYVSQRQLYGKSGTDWASVAAVVSGRKGPGEAVYFSPRVVPTGPTVRLTTRSIQAAYPKAFTGLTDLTLTRTPAAAGDITGLSRTLSDSRSELARARGVWVISRQDYPLVQQRRDDALLNAAGFVVAYRWNGPLDVVTEFVRAR